MEPERRTDTAATWLWRGYLALGLVLIVGYYSPILPAVRSLLYDWFAVSAVIAIVVGIVRYRPASPACWWLLALGVAMMAAGDLAWEFYERALGIEAPFPSIADALYLGGYPILTAALLGLSHRRSRGSERGLLIDGAIIGISYGVAAWFFFLEPSMRDPSYPLVERLISAAYPGMDVLVVAAAALVLLTPGARSPAFAFLTGGVAIYIAADIFYA